MNIREALALAYIFDLEVIEEVKAFAAKLIQQTMASGEIVYD